MTASIEQMFSNKQLKKIAILEILALTSCKICHCYHLPKVCKKKRWESADGYKKTLVQFLRIERSNIKR